MTPADARAVPVGRRALLVGLRRYRDAAVAAGIGLAVAALLVAPVALFGALTMRTALDDLERRSDQERATVAALASGIVGRSVAGRGDLLTVFGVRDFARDAYRRGDGAQLALLLEPIVSGRPDIATALALDSSGRVLARIPTDPAALGQSFADRDYYAGALRSPAVYVSGALTSRIDPSLVLVVLATAVRDDVGKLLGLAIFTVRVQLVLDEVRDALSVDGREILLIDDRAATIASTTGREPLSKSGLPIANGAGVTVMGGEQRLFVARPVAGTPWTLYVLDDPQVVYAAQADLARDLGRQVFAELLVAALAAVVVAMAYLIVARQRTRLGRANAELREANARIEAATRAKSDFLASMSHELRTPMNAILGFSDVLAEQLGAALTPRQSRYLANIRSAGVHLLELINDVLDLSKVEAGRLQIRREPVRLTTVLEPVVASAAQLAVDRGVSFEAGDIPDEVVHVDPARVRQVLLNLLSNAVKFTPAGGHVDLVAATTDGSVEFAVRDTGIGIPADRQDRVFGLFERLHEGRSEVPGTGLGLAITKRLVELHGGTIGFESEEGRGTRFWVRLEGAVAAATAGPRILVVEDDRCDAELIAAIVAERGLAAEVAPTAASALDAVARGRPYAVILDLRLPDRRGEEVLWALKADPKTAAIPILVVSVEDDDGGPRAMGASDHMTKPIDRERLLRWLAATVREEGRVAAVAG